MFFRFHLPETLLLSAGILGFAQAATTTSSAGQCLVLTCTQDACYNQQVNTAVSSQASAFCSTYTTTTNTNTAAIPTYLNSCSNPSQVSSACSCLNNRPNTAPSTSSSSKATCISIVTTSVPTSSTSSSTTLTTSTSTSSLTSTSTTKSTSSSTSSSSTSTSKSSSSSTTTSTSKSTSSSTTTKSTSTLSTSTTKSTTSSTTSKTSSSTSTTTKSSTTTTKSTTTTSKSTTTSSKTTTTSAASVRVLVATTTTSSSCVAVQTQCGTAEATPYWIEGLKHQGKATYNSNSTYQVYRNVKCFGAKGDGTTDDTAAINAAIASSNRCGSGCQSSTTQPAYVYFPGGTYLISSPINALYYTQLVGNPNNRPVIKGTSGFTGYALIDADPGYPNNRYYGPTNNFFRSIRNFVLDTTSIPATSYGTGIHWPVAQATSVQNVLFQMSSVSGNLHQGIYGEEGSGGMLNDLTFNNGKYGIYMGNQQFTLRNMAFNNQAASAIYVAFSWGWTFKNMRITGAPIGIDMSATSSSNLQDSSINILDSTFTNVNTAVLTGRNSASQTPKAAGGLVMSNVACSNVGIVVGSSISGGSTTTNLAGSTGSLTVNYRQGKEYTPTGSGSYVQGSYTAESRPSSLITGSSSYYVEKSKPLYASNKACDFVSVRTAGAKGDGVTDDTAALQSAITSATSAGKIVFIDQGVYLVRSTITVPAGARIVGEDWPRLMADGTSSSFNSMSSPQPMLKVGNAGDSGLVEISDIVVQTKGAAPGAILIQWNLASSSNTNPSGMWDVHANIGGSAGTNLQSTNCPTSSTSTSCIGAFMIMHITTSAAGVYLENTWLWTADHDLDISGQTQINVFTGRGLYIQSTNGPVWLYGTAVEHNVMYNYQFVNAANIFGGFMQTETPYFQSAPMAPAPFTMNTAYNDPNFDTLCSSPPGSQAQCRKAYGLRIVTSTGVRIFGVGLYSFFEKYTQTCISSNSCQLFTLSLEKLSSSATVNINGLNTVGTLFMIIKDGGSIVYAPDNPGTFPYTITDYHASTSY